MELKLCEGFAEVVNHFYPFNRTSMELKRVVDLPAPQLTRPAFNRTSMELKRCGDTEFITRELIAFNRTSMELKPKHLFCYALFSGGF